MFLRLVCLFWNVYVGNCQRQRKVKVKVDPTLADMTTSSISSRLLSFTIHADHRRKGWKQDGEEDEWVTKAVDTLVKKLKAKDSLEKLEKALRNREAQSKCVLLARPLDTRLQVIHRKYQPHLISCRIWRWPDLQNHHELKALECCQCPYSAKMKEVCINPYHYQRVQSPALPAVLVSRGVEYPAPVPNSANLPYPARAEEGLYRYDGPYQNAAPHPQQIFEGHISPYGMTVNSPMSSYQMHNSPHSLMGGDENMETQPSPIQGHHNMASYSMVNGHCPQNYPRNGGFSEVKYQEADNWCSISYFELNSRVGEVFYASTKNVVVDGYTDPSTNASRFCLGPLSNIHRNPVVENARKHIGKGLMLRCEGEAIYVDCLSKDCIFVESRLYNCMHDLHPKTVYKVTERTTHMIFDQQYFAQLLSQAASRSYEAVFELTKMCSINVSFLKGWGGKYQRRDVTNTPCWIEIILNGPLQWIDRVLAHMGSPHNPISSVS